MLTALPNGFVESTVASGLTHPTAFEFAPDGRIFIAQKEGAIRVVKDGQLLPTPFLDLNLPPTGESGLLGIAFDPNFTANSYVYAYYTAYEPTTHNRLSRFTAAGDVVAPGSETPILDLEPTSDKTNHNGGALHFGPDGKIYVGVGDALMSANGQSMSSLFGKILRINPDGSIPADNPFYETATGQSRSIWALGLRNPFSFAFQPVTGRMFIDDVGENSWEEINDGVAGANYGWATTEGPTTDPRFRTPIYAYPTVQNNETRSAITGGVFYNPLQNQFPASATGAYFFTDLLGGWIRRLDPDSGAVTEFAADLAPFPVALGVDHAGSLYYLAFGSGAGVGVLNKIQYVPEPVNQAPSVTRQPASMVAALGQSVVFSVEAYGSPVLTYQWLRNNTQIPGATGPTLTIPVVTARDLGASYRVIVTNSVGSTVSQPAVLLAASPYAQALFTAVFQRPPEPDALATLTLMLKQGVTPRRLALTMVTSPGRRLETVVAAYQSTLRRAPTGAELTTGLDQLNAGASRQSLRAALLSSPEYTARQGGLSPRVVQSIYQDLLGRAPRRTELNQGVRRVVAGGATDLVNRLNASTEAMSRLIANVYTADLRRRPRPEEVKSSVAQLRRGLSVDQFEANLLSNREFIARNGGL